VYLFIPPHRKRIPWAENYSPWCGAVVKEEGVLDRFGGGGGGSVEFWSRVGE
jgi:hypothetical protein